MGPGRNRPAWELFLIRILVRPPPPSSSRLLYLSRGRKSNRSVHSCTVSHFFPLLFFFPLERSPRQDARIDSAPRCSIRGEIRKRRRTFSPPPRYRTIRDRSFVRSVQRGSCIIIIYAIITFMTHFILVNCPRRSRPLVITRLGYDRFFLPAWSSSSFDLSFDLIKIAIPRGAIENAR